MPAKKSVPKVKPKVKAIIVLPMKEGKMSMKMDKKKDKMGKC